jgi:ADP-heptose:LPS heptosyltransferase
MSENKKILIRANTGGIGDFVWATSAVSLIKQFDKNIDITLITSDIFISLTNKNLDIKNILSCNKKYNYSKNKLIKIIYRIYWCIKIYHKVKKENYDLMIFLDHCYITSFFAKYIYKIKNIAGPNILPYGYNTKNNSSKFYTNVIDLPLDFDRLHCMMAYQIMIRKIFPTYNLSLPILPDTDALAQEIKQKFLQDIKKYKIVLCTYGSKQCKNWNIENFKILTEQINNIYPSTFFVLGNNKEENNNAVYLQNNLKNIDIRNLVAKTNLLELKEFLNNIDLLISVDTGTMHIAATTNMKIISLHGFSLPEHTMPVSSKVKIVCTYEKCSPCISKVYNGKYNCKDIKCMNNITVDMVLKSVKEILK